MSVGAWVGIVVGCIAILAAVGRLLWATHKGLNLFEALITRVGAMETVLNNGIRADIRDAKEAAQKAVVLAGDAARAASVADEQGRETARGLNALRAEVDIYTNVVLSDRQRIRVALKELGHDVGGDDDE